MKNNVLLFAMAGSAVAGVLPSQPTQEQIQALAVFAEPMVPVGASSGVDAQKLAVAVNAWAARTDPDDYSALENFSNAHPTSPWALAVRINLADTYYKSGRFRKALGTYEKAWNDSKGIPEANPYADVAAAGYFGLLARVGRFDELQTCFSEVGARTFEGSAGQKIAQAKVGLYEMLNVPGKSFKCGPMALWAIQRANQVPAGSFAQYLHEIQSPQNGFDLLEVWEMSQQLGMNLQMAYREPRSEVLFPSVVHWKVNHYGAITGAEGGKFHVEDVTFVQDFWPTRAAIDDEASGYFLVRAGALPAGWRPVEVEEARRIRGKGNTSNSDTNGTGDDDPTEGDKDCPKGMPRASVHAMLVSLKIEDIPVGYAPPAGSPVQFRVVYSQKDNAPPAVANEPGLGPRWRMDWFSYVAYKPNDPSASVSVFARGGGAQVYKGFTSTNNVSGMNWVSPTRLERSAGSGARTFIRSFPDGSREVFEQDDGVPVTGGTLEKKVYLSRIVDPAGRETRLVYDSLRRVVKLVDCFGKETKIDYDPVSTYRIVRVTDPFGRFASFTYNATGRLASITDVAGLTSSFEYTGDFIHAMETPYGRTGFAFADEDEGQMRWLETTDPLGNKERVEYRNDWPGRGQAFGDPAEDVPSASGLLLFNNWLGARNTFYWDKKAYAEGAGDYSKAKILHWLHSPGNTWVTDRVLESEKKPFSSRVWYNYIGSTDMVYGPGTTALPTKVARVVDGPNGTRQTQLFQRTYNAVGHVLSETDPIGRVVNFTYDASGVNLLDVKSGNQTLMNATYSANRLPLTLTDAAGQTTRFTYNAKGQLLTITDALGGVTSLSYSTEGYLTSLDGPLANDTIAVGWDAFGRVAKVTGADGYILEYEYDNLDRITKVKYPDGSSELTTYDKLDVASRQDRMGRLTRYWHNKLGQLVAVMDPLGRWTAYQWCRCGDLRELQDALGRVTKWKHDVQGRVTAKVFPDNSTVLYGYDLSSRLATITDATGQARSLTYNRDDTVAAEKYLNAIHPTPEVGFSWNGTIRRLDAVSDGSGATKFTYHPYGSVGGGRVASVDGPLASDTVTTSYDALGRTAQLAIAGTARDFVYDVGSRLTRETNALGAFDYTYVGGTRRLAGMSGPNGLAAAFSYLPNAQDRRLAGIAHTGPGGVAVSSFGYGYDTGGSITQWTQSQPFHTMEPMSAWTIEQDAADQLTGVSVEGRAAGRQVFSYDLAGNRLTAQSGNATSTTAYNALNQITGISGGGRLRFSGTTSEAAHVSVQGRAARMLDDKTFTADAEVVPGVNTIPVVATDGNGNRRTNNYQVTVPGAATRAFVYDGNGNLLDDGERTYQWDAKNRLIEAKRGADTWQWGYNAFDQRVSEKKNGVVTKRWVWAGGNQPAEERDAAGNVMRRFYPQGEQAGATKYFYTKDHLGSIREVMGANGTVVSSSRYDAWGVRTTQGAQDAASFGFTGHLEHKELGLVFTLYRAYDPVTGRWLSRDPIGEDGGINLYGYVSNNPISFRDPLGLSPAGAAQDFLDQYNNMREANWTNSDKYFHCMANCNAAKRGKSGYDTAKALSEAREWFDENIKRDSKNACDADRQANDHGREAGKNDEDCKSACEKYRPAGLPSKY